MSDIDKFASSLLEEAKRFLEKVDGTTTAEAEAANLHAALMLAFCSVEAHVNAVADEIALRQGISVHDLAILLEKEVHLKDGCFTLGSKLKMYKIEERIAVLCRIGAKAAASSSWRARLGSAIELRNKLTHPKEVPAITVAAVKRSLEAVIETIDVLYLSVYKKRFPAANRRLSSKLDF